APFIESAGPKPRVFVLLLQICTDYPKAGRNGPATEHERDTGTLALCHSPVTASKQELERRVAIATAASKGPHSQKPPFFCSDKAILNVELYQRADSFKD